MLGFRTLLRTHDEPELLDVAFSEVRAWLISKNYDPTGMDRSGTIGAADGVELTLQRHTDDVGSPTLRVTVVERQPTGTWTSQLVKSSRVTSHVLEPVRSASTRSQLPDLGGAVTASLQPCH